MQEEPDLDMGGELRLEGLVVDARGQPVAGASVSLDSKSHVLSDDAGRFVFVDRAPGMYRLGAHRDDLCADITVVTLHDRREPIVLTMSPGITLRLRVQDGEAPVAAARVSGVADNETLAVTGSDGIAIVRGVCAQFQMFEVQADGYAPIFVSMWLAPDPGGTIERNVALSRGAPLGGVVLGADGVPVAGVTVRIFSPTWGGDVTTDARGQWRLDAVGPGTYEVRASSETLASMPDLIVELDGTTACTDLVVRVQNGGQFVGAVVDRDGNPVRRAVVMALRTDAEHRAESAVRGDDAGRFEMLGLVPATYEVFAHDSHRASAITRVSVANGDVARIDLIVEDAAIAGVVVDRHGNPVAGAEVRADAPIVVGDVSDAHGQFFLGALPPGEYEVQAGRPEQPERARGASATVKAGDTEAKLVLPGEATIQGRVLLDGAPVRHFGVLLSTCPQFPWIGRPTGFHSDDGRFSMRGVSAGTWGLVFAGRGTAMHTVSLEVEEGATLEIGDVQLVRGQCITGHVRDASGAPVPGARVIIGRRGLDDDYEVEPLQQWFQCEFETVTGADGAFTFDGVSSVRPPNARPTPITAIHPQRGASLGIALPEGDANVELVLLETGTIEGVVEGFAGGFASVAAHRKGEPADLRSTRVTPSGTFVLDSMPPGDYAIVMTGLPRKPVAAPAKATVTASQRTTVRLVMP